LIHHEFLSLTLRRSKKRPFNSAKRLILAFFQPENSRRKVAADALLPFAMEMHEALILLRTIKKTERSTFPSLIFGAKWHQFKLFVPQASVALRPCGTSPFFGTGRSSAFQA